jgi:hypothetical protein
MLLRRQFLIGFCAAVGSGISFVTHRAMRNADLAGQLANRVRQLLAAGETIDFAPFKAIAASERELLTGIFTVNDTELLRLTHASDATLRRCIAENIRNDFAMGRIEVRHGWRLAATEIAALQLLARSV